jgi:hypothetical protein
VAWIKLEQRWRLPEYNLVELDHGTELTAFLRWMVEIMRQLLDETGVQPATATGGASQNWHTIKWLIGLCVGVSPPTHDP